MIVKVLPEQLIQLIKEELNVKEVEFVDNEEDLEGMYCVNSLEPNKFFRVINEERVYDNGI